MWLSSALWQADGSNLRSRTIVATENASWENTKEKTLSHTHTLKYTVDRRVVKFSIQYFTFPGECLCVRCAAGVHNQKE